MRTDTQIAAVFGCTPEQARAQKQRNAASIRKYSERDLNHAGWTREQANRIADEFER